MNRNETETSHARSYPLRGRVQVALPERSVAAGRTLSVSVHELCVVLDDQIPIGASLMIRFELFARGRMNVVTALAKAAYGVFASQGGFRVGFEFAADDKERSALIQGLGARKPVPGVAEAAPAEPVVAPPVATLAPEPEPAAAAVG